MPSKPASYCNGCGQPSRGACPRCKKVSNKAADKSRGSAHQRGYGAVWQKLRKYVLSMEPMCRHCRTQPAAELDHIVRKADGGNDDYANLQPLCRSCHEYKTLQENKGKGGA
jgi:5-methylcytosine-specific restriction protein A